MSTLTIDATIENIEKIIAYIDNKLFALNCTANIRAQLDIAIDEIVSNIVFYAYPGEPGKVTVRFTQAADPPAVYIAFEDSGIPFDPLKNPDPEIGLCSQERTMGGLGIYLVKKTMDSVSYEYKGGKNILTLGKRLV